MLVRVASGGNGPMASPKRVLGMAAFIAKMVAGAVVLGAWEVSIAKMRVFRVPELLGVAFIFAFLAILLAFLSRELLG